MINFIRNNTTLSSHSFFFYKFIIYMYFVFIYKFIIFNLLKIFMYLFIFGHSGSSFLHRPSLVSTIGGYSALPLTAVASLVAERGL